MSDPNLFEELRFAKKQQWGVTNYSALVLVAIFGLAKEFSVSEKWWIAWLAIIAGGIAICLIAIIQGDIANIRYALEQKTKRSIAAQSYRDRSRFVFRDWYFMAALMSVSWSGALLVFYYFSHSVCALVTLAVTLIAIALVMCLWTVPRRFESWLRSEGHLL